MTEFNEPEPKADSQYPTPVEFSYDISDEALSAAKPGDFHSQLHWDELTLGSGLHPNVIKQNNILCHGQVSKSLREELRPHLTGFNGSITEFPLYDLHLEWISSQFKPEWGDLAVYDKGKKEGEYKPKYLSARKNGNPPFVSRCDWGIISAGYNGPIAITEGTKCAISLSVHTNIPTIGLNGCHGFSRRRDFHLNETLKTINWKGRTAYVVLDSDVLTNKDVSEARLKIAYLLKKEGAIVKLVDLPSASELLGDVVTDEQREEADLGKIGVDDFLTYQGFKKIPIQAAKLIEMMESGAEEFPEPEEKFVKTDCKSVAPYNLAVAFSKGYSIEVDGDVRPRMICIGNNIYNFFSQKVGWIELEKSQAEACITDWIDKNEYYNSNSGTAKEVLAKIKSMGYGLSQKHVPMWMTRPDEVPDSTDDLIVSPDYIYWHNKRSNKLKRRVKDLSLVVVGSIGMNLPTDAEADQYWQECPEMEQFIHQAFNGNAESIDCFQRWCGLNLTGILKEEKMMLLHGPPRSGKGILIDSLKQLVGDFGVNSKPADFEGRSNGMRYMHKRNLIIADFYSTDRRERSKSTGEMIQLASAEKITSHKMNHGTVDVPTSVRVTAACNDVDSVINYSNAMAARVIALSIPISHSGINQDADLKTRLVDHDRGRNAFRAWAYWGLKKYLGIDGDPGLMLPQSSQDLTDDVLDDMNPVKEFLESVCIVKYSTSGLRYDGYRTTQRDLLEAFKEYIVGDSYGADITPEMKRKTTLSHFTKNIRKLGFQSCKMKHGSCPGKIAGFREIGLPGKSEVRDGSGKYTKFLSNEGKIIDALPEEEKQQQQQDFQQSSDWGNEDF